MASTLLIIIYIENVLQSLDFYETNLYSVGYTQKGQWKGKERLYLKKWLESDILIIR
jgi:hypothetical protein